MSGWIMQPINFMGCLLGLSQSNKTGAAANERGRISNPKSSPSCSGWPRPDPVVRLRVSDDKTVRIFGFPTKDLPAAMPLPLTNFGNFGPVLLYLRGDVHAYVTYVMGSDWREKLRDDHKTDDQHTYHDGKVILRPRAPTDNESAEAEAIRDERAHCVRMLRCGATGVRSEVDAAKFDTLGWERPPMQLFGWPSYGGVWILRYPEFDENVHMLDAIRPNQEAMEEYSWQEFQFREVENSLSQYSDMDELCRALENAGAEYYAALEDCPEVVEMELITS